MLQGGYKIRDQSAIHFITFAVVEWIDVFTRKTYSDIIIDSLKYCQDNKGLWLHAWCIMSNHLHLVAAAANQDLSDVLRDFKKYTSKKIVSAIEENVQESRRDWMLPIFREQGERNSRNKKYQFWRQSLSRVHCGNNRPEELYSPRFITQKINYIHNNPVVAGIVEKPEHYLNSSARDYLYGKKCGVLDIIFL